VSIPWASLANRRIANSVKISLPESKSDTVLEVGITKAFSVFGPVFVKIRRDPKNMPFAFCQYTVC
jgi:hypothetical protein